MVIHEKALVQEMKSAYRGWGYTVAVRPDGRWAIYTPDWLVVMAGQGNVPNEVLALIVLHMGELPAYESAHRIYKCDTGPMIQKEVFAVVNEEIDKLMTLARIENHAARTIQRTKLMLGACQVWQKEHDLAIFLMDPGFTRLIDSKDTVQVADYVYAEGDTSSVFVKRAIGAAEKTHIDHLAQMQWVEQ